MGVCYSYVLRMLFYGERLLNVTLTRTLFETDEEAVRTTGLFNNLYLLLMETESILYKEDNGWKILVHDRQQTPVIDIRTHGSTLHNGWGKDIRIYIRQVNLAWSKAPSSKPNLTWSLPNTNLI